MVEGEDKEPAPVEDIPVGPKRSFCESTSRGLSGQMDEPGEVPPTGEETRYIEVDMSRSVVEEVTVPPQTEDVSPVGKRLREVNVELLTPPFFTVLRRVRLCSKKVL